MRVFMCVYRQRDGVNGEISTAFRSQGDVRGSSRWQLYGESDRSRDPSPSCARSPSPAMRTTTLNTFDEPPV